jgi:haloacetate dehalogenase
MFDGFDEATTEVGGVPVFFRAAGSGPVVVLLHGHPRTSATWHRVAPLLVEAGFRVIAPDLRGYGRSGTPDADDEHRVYSKRSTANDIVGLMDELGHDRFAVVGHDRGSYVGLRLAVDHPDRVSRLVVMDGVPISEAVARADVRFAKRWWHWFFYAQADLPEQAINADPVAWYSRSASPERMGQENYEELMRAVRDPATVRAMLEDYRAGLTVDHSDELGDVIAGRGIRCPLLVLWAARDDLPDLYSDPVDVWSGWAADRRGHSIDSGHHMAEEAPEELAAALVEFLREDGSAGS